MTLFCSGCPVAGGVVFVTRIVHRASFASAPCGEAFAVKIEVADAVLCFRQSQVGSPFQPPACFHQIARHTCAAEVVPADGVGDGGFFLVVVIAPVGSFFIVEYPEEIFFKYNGNFPNLQYFTQLMFETDRETIGNLINSV